MRKLAILLLACSGLAVQTASATEDGCRAVMYFQSGDVKLPIQTFTTRAEGFFTKFSARIIARNKAIACVRKARDFINAHRKPNLCEPSAGVHDYDIVSLGVLTNVFACGQNTRGDTYQVRLEVSGGKGCRADEVIMTRPFKHEICMKVGAWEMGSDRPGSDYKDFVYAGANPRRCQTECVNDPKCKSWTVVSWYPPTPSSPSALLRNPKKSHCWLKTHVPQQKESGCCISGVKGIEGHTDRPGGDYNRIELTSSNPATCKAICVRDPRCRAWAADTNSVQFVPGVGQVCWLKDGIRPPIWATGIHSGIKGIE